MLRTLATLAAGFCLVVAGSVTSQASEPLLSVEINDKKYEYLTISQAAEGMALMVADRPSKYAGRHIAVIGATGGCMPFKQQHQTWLERHPKREFYRGSFITSPDSTSFYTPLFYGFHTSQEASLDSKAIDQAEAACFARSGGRINTWSWPVFLFYGVVVSYNEDGTNRLRHLLAVHGVKFADAWASNPLQPSAGDVLSTALGVLRK